MKQKRFRLKQLSFRAALLLFCALLATLGMAVGLHARYTTGASASDGARVAKFEITETGVENMDITADIAPGETKTQKLTIENKSEVAVDYTITVTNVTNNLPIAFTVNNQPADDDGTYTYTDTLSPNAEKQEYTVKIIWPAEDAEDKDPKYAGMVDLIKVSISAVQAD